MRNSEWGLRPGGAIEAYAPEGMQNDVKRSWEGRGLKAQGSKEELRADCAKNGRARRAQNSSKLKVLRNSDHYNTFHMALITFERLYEAHTH